MRWLRAFRWFVVTQYPFLIAGAASYIGSIPSWGPSLRNLFPQYRFLHDLADWIFGHPTEFFVALGIIALIRAYYEEWTREDDRKESCIIVLSVTPQPLIVGSPIAAALRIGNSGGMTSRANAVVNAYKVDIPTNGTTEADLASRLWNNDFAPARGNMDNLLPNMAIRSHEDAPPLSISGEHIIQDDIDKYNDGKKRFYFMGSIVYEDARGKYHTDFCRYWDRKISTAPMTSTVHNEEHILIARYRRRPGMR